jgi:hypothetical protein
VCDDAYISFRYSRHLAAGEGLVFNLGEDPPVEGYSNLLWVLWIAPFEALGVPPEIPANATSIACAALLVFLLVRYAERRLGLHAPALAALALGVVTCPVLALWATSGLETMAFALASFLSFERLTVDPARPRGLQAGAASLCAALLRADGAAIAGAFLGLALFGGWAGRSRVLVRAAALALAVLVAGALLHLSWRWSYHHELLPNTAQAKVGLSAMRLERGWKYVGSLVLALPAGALVFLGGLAAGAPGSRILRAQCAAALLLLVAYSISVGGDFMPMGRFLVPALPFLALLGAALLARVWPEQRVRPALSVALAGAVVASQVLAACDVPCAPRAWRDALHFRWNSPEWRSEVDQWRQMRERVALWRRTGKALALHTKPGESIVQGTIGAIGYYSELVIYDTLGLVSPEAARAGQLERASPGHDRHVEPEFFFPKKPTYLGAWLRGPGAPEETSLANGELVRSGRASLERFPLDGFEGAPPGTHLLVLRMHW